jgi:hypothetical protein
MLSASTGSLCLRSQPIICFRISHRRVCIQKCASQSPSAASMSMLSRLAKRLVDTAEHKQEHTAVPTSSGEVLRWCYTSIETRVQYFADFAEVYRIVFPSCGGPLSRSSQSRTAKPLFKVLITFCSLLMFNPTFLRKVSHLLFKPCKDNSSHVSKTYQGTYRGTSASNM